MIVLSDLDKVILVFESLPTLNDDESSGFHFAADDETSVRIAGRLVPTRRSGW